MNTPAPSADPAEQQALDWFVRAQGALTPPEQAELDAWLAADDRRRAAFARWQQDWSALDALPADGVQALRDRLAHDIAASRQLPARPWWQFFGRFVPQAALAAVVLVVSAGSFMAWNAWQQQPVFAQGFHTPRGHQADITLPDGSQMRLDTATRTEVALYRQRREVRLPEGQVVFHVKGDPDRPFDVLAGPLRITVVGTRFSVRYLPGLPGAPQVRVAVEEGHVRVSQARPHPSQTPATTELVAGQQVSSDAAGVLGEVSAVPPAGIAAWRQNRVSFDDATLAQALAEFERYGATRLAVNDPAVASLRLSGTFDPRRLDNFMRVLPQVLPVVLRERDGSTEIVAAK